MKVLVVHNRYLERGGEDAVFEAESRLLSQSGHEVRQFERNNTEIAQLGSLRTAIDSWWSTDTQRRMTALIDDWHPDVVHVHNSFPLVSPSVYWAAAAKRVAVVKTLHNFRLACLQGTFLYQGRNCEQCLGHMPWQGVVRGCYRGSTAQSLALATGIAGHRWAGTYRKHIDRFIALDAFSVEKFVAAGLPRQLIRVKPNAVAMPDAPASPGPRSGGLYVGRLSPEKGIHTLVEALAMALPPRFRIIGDGELRNSINPAHAQALGQSSSAVVHAAMATAQYLVLPSLGYEQFPIVLAEAFAMGLPVIGSAHGSLANLIDNQRTGLLVPPGDAQALAQAMAWAEANPSAMLAMGQQCRAEYLAKYTEQANLRALVTIYEEAMAHRSAR